MQPEPPPRDLGDVTVSAMGGVERAPEQADARTPPVAETRNAVAAAGAAQGRTWPVPITW